MGEPDEHVRALAAAIGPEAAPQLRLVVLFGSRARGDAHARSDWDVGFLADAAFDADRLLAILVERLGADRVDLVDLGRAGALLRHRVARDGIAVFEREASEFTRFWLDAVGAWCDLAPVLLPLYDRALEGAAP